MRAVVAGNRLISDWPEGAIKAVSPHLVEVPLARGEMLHEGIYFPISGLIAEFILVKDKRLYTGLVGTDGAFGLEYLGEPSHIKAVVLVPGRAGRISNFRDIWARSDVVREMQLRYCQSRLASAQQSAACNAVHAAGPRFCDWLLRARHSLGEDLIPLTQEQAADMLGIRRTTVNLLAQELHKAGIVNCGRGRITILDCAGLEALSCGCSEPGSPQAGL